MIDIEKLKTTPLYASMQESDEVQLVHIMLRSSRWEEYERPENYPLWLPKDALCFFEHFFRKSITENRIAEVFSCLQKEGIVRKSGKLGYCLME
jgi:hypothetical protein